MDIIRKCCLPAIIYILAVQMDANAQINFTPQGPSLADKLQAGTNQIIQMQTLQNLRLQNEMMRHQLEQIHTTKTELPPSQFREWPESILVDKHEAAENAFVAANPWFIENQFLRNEAIKISDELVAKINAGQANYTPHEAFDIIEKRIKKKYPEMVQ